MRILIIEDDRKLAGSIGRGLRESGYVVDLAFDGDYGLQMALAGPHDLVILDLMLPVLDGWAVLETLRQQRRSLGVLLLTARDAVQDRVRGLNLGADDYLPKPFAFAELLARVRAVLRRGSADGVTSCRYDDLEIDLRSRRVVRSGRELDLTQKEFSLLWALTRRAGEVLSRQMIVQQVWNLDFDCDSNVVDVHMYRLRAKIDDPFARKLIHTVRGFGYVLGDEASTR